jgi:hypothetical protein
VHFCTTSPFSVLVNWLSWLFSNNLSLQHSTHLILPTFLTSLITYYDSWQRPCNSFPVISHLSIHCFFSFPVHDRRHIQAHFFVPSTAYSFDLRLCTFFSVDFTNLSPCKSSTVHFFHPAISLFCANWFGIQITHEYIIICSSWIHCNLFFITVSMYCELFTPNHCFVSSSSSCQVRIGCVNNGTVDDPYWLNEHVDASQYCSYFEYYIENWNSISTVRWQLDDVQFQNMWVQLIVDAWIRSCCSQHISNVQKESNWDCCNLPCFSGYTSHGSWVHPVWYPWCLLVLLLDLPSWKRIEIHLQDDIHST